MKSREYSLRPRSLVFLAAGLLSLGMGLGAASQGSATPGTVMDFDQDIAGQAPVGFTSYATGEGPPGKWVVQKMADAPDGQRVVVQTDADNTDNRFPVLIADGGEYTDVEVRVKGKAISGQVDQGIGLVFRFRDPRSYYVVRANALENNVRLYKMVDGRRIQIAGSDIKVTSGQWHTLQVTARGDHIVCSFDGQKLIDVQDATYAKGKVGLWTKADSVTAFAGLTVAKL